MSDTDGGGENDTEAAAGAIRVTAPEVAAPARDFVVASTGRLATPEAEAALRRGTEQARLRALRRGEGVELGAAAIGQLIEARQFAATAVYRRLAQFNDELEGFFTGVVPTLPAKLTGELINPDGTPADRIQVEALRPEFGRNEGVGEFAWAPRKAVTDRRGMFSLSLPPLRVPQNGLRLRLRGRNGVSTLNVARIDAIDGQIGLAVLSSTLLALPQSVIAQLADLFPVDEIDAVENVDDFRTEQPPLVIGEGDCAHEYRTQGGTVSRHRYSVLFRLVDPLLGPPQLRREITAGGTIAPVSVPSKGLAAGAYTASDVVAALSASPGNWAFADRVPIDEPIDVGDYFDDLESDPEQVPKAASLGLGYVVKMGVVGIHQGLSLGRPVYSLPLAPGEEQQIAVFEQRERLSVSERETLDVTEEQQFNESVDTSLDATFESSLDEMISGESKFDTHNHTDSKGRSGGFGAGFGGSGPIGKGIGKIFGSITGGFSGGFSESNSDSSGSASSSQNTSRDFLSETHENFSSALQRSSRLKRNATRTSVRLATRSDRQSVTTKIIANRNHCHALTMQWFEVLRDYLIDTRVDGVQLVAFVPMQLIRFAPIQQLFETVANSTVKLRGDETRGDLVERYGVVHRYAETLRRALPGRRYRRALDTLEDFIADPSIEPQGAQPNAQLIVKFSIFGAFFPNDDISASIITKEGARIGPARLSGPSMNVDTFDGHRARDEDQLIAGLRNRRRLPLAEFGGNLALPISVTKADIARIELTRRTGSFAYRFDDPDEPVQNFLELIKDLKDQADPDRLLKFSLSAEEFDDVIGPPQLGTVTAQIDGENIVSDPGQGVLPPNLPVPVRAFDEVLTQKDLRLIEDLYQHVLRNTVSYSRAIWVGMTDEERAILLERFTLGVPEGGLVDAASEIPLLSAVGNKVLGFYGNMMIMPFSIPAQLAQETGLTSGQIQDAILRFHREGFHPPRRQISLPTRGLLGEAVLGRCNSCETIDHRRFWNWQDSPIPAPVSAAPTFPAPQGNLLSATAPSALLTNPPPTNLTIAAGGSGGSDTAGGGGSALAEILKAAPELAKGGANLTGLAELQKLLEQESKSVAAGRDNAFNTTTKLTTDLVAQAAALLGKKAETKGEEAKAKAAKEENDKKEETKKEENKAKKEEQAATTKTAAFPAQAAQLSENAAQISRLAGSQENPVGFARSVLAGLFTGTSGLTLANTALPVATLLAAFQEVETEHAPEDDAGPIDLSDSEQVRRAQTAEGALAFISQLEDLDSFFGPNGTLIKPAAEQ